jgi:ABC-type polysaccharide/polyol phosphate export permease
MYAQLAELWRFRDLLRQLIARELKVRYKNSAFGFLWSIVPVCLQVVVFTFFIRNAVNLPAESYGAYMLCGLIPWTFFNAALLDSGQTLRVNYPILKKVYLPREVFPLCSALSNFVHCALGWAVYFAVYFGLVRFIGIHLPFKPTLLLFPLITLVLLILVAGLCLWVSILSLFYEDVRFIVQTFMNLLMFVLPVLVPADVIRYSSFFKAKPWLYDLYMMNPISALIDAYRKSILEELPRGSFNMTGEPLHFNWLHFGGATAITLCIFVTGYAYFNARKWEIVERW